MAAQEDGFTELKFFPPCRRRPGHAQGLEWAVRDVKFCPTGGITAPTQRSFWHCPMWPVLAVLLVPADALARGDWARVTELARQAAGLPR